MLMIKDYLEQLFKSKASSIKILYGGSVNEINAKDILKIKGVDGVLVGGASLDPQKF
jgi:triosephosphate isomerase